MKHGTEVEFINKKYGGKFQLISTHNFPTFNLILRILILYIFQPGVGNLESQKFYQFLLELVALMIRITEDGPIKFRAKRLILEVLLNPVHSTLADIFINLLQFYQFFILNFKQFWHQNEPSPTLCSLVTVDR